MKALRRHKWMISGLALMGMLALLYALRSRNHSVPTAMISAASASNEGGSPPPKLAQVRLPPPQQPKPSSPDAAPIIDAVKVEKAEVCEGEENLVTIAAHMPDGSNEFLHYAIGNQQGPQIPLRAYLKKEGSGSEKQTVLVFGKDNIPTAAEVPAYRVNPCKPERLALITVRAITNTVSEYEFLVRVIEQTKDKAFHAVRYRWDFGDDEKQDTSGPITTHSYRARKQKALMSNFLVRVEVIGASGEKVLGRHSLVLANPAFEARAKGMVALFTEPNPRYPTMGDDGIVKQSFRIWHSEDQPVEITKVRVVKQFNAGQASMAPPQVEEKDVAILARTDIPPGDGVTQEFSVNFSSELASLYAVNYYLEGISADGMIAQGSFSILKPPPKPTAENSVHIQDPAMVAKIHRALQILHRDTVSQEDLRQLEEQGRL